MRYSGDDFCYAAELARHGFFGVQWESYFEPVAYSGNRYSLTGASAVAGLLPPATSGLIPSLALAGLGAGLGTFLHRIWPSGLPGESRLERWSVAAVLVFLVAYQAPDFVQSVLWRSGLFPYLAPLVGQTWLASLVVSSSPRASRPVGLLGIGGLAFVSGGFSETGATLQICWLFLLVLGSFAVSRRIPVSLKAALLGAGLAAAILAVSPSDASHWEQLPSRLSLGETVSLTLRCPQSFLLGSLTGNPVPSLATLGFLATLSTHFVSQDRLGAWTGREFAVKGLVLPIAAAYLMIAATCAPSVVAQLSYPGLRALLPARYVMVLLLAWIGFAGGRTIAPVWIRLVPSAKVRSWLTCAILVLVGVYSLRAATILAAGYPRYRGWSAAWDSRHRQILALVEAGVTDIVTHEIDHIVPEVAEPRSDPAAWYNVCVAQYYGVRSFTALPP